MQAGNEVNQSKPLKLESVITRKKTSTSWFNGDEILALEPETELWLVDKLIPYAALSGLTGPSDCGKSTLAKQLVLSVISGKGQFLGRTLSVKHKRALYVCTEESPIDVKDILALQKEGLGIESAANAGFLFNPDGLIRRLQAVLINKPVDLIVIDTWSDTLEGDSNSLHLVRKNLNPLHKLATEFNCAILLIHHNVKHSEKAPPDKNKASGSQAFEAKCRSLLEIRLGVSDNQRVLTLLKGNRVKQSEKGKGIELFLDDYRVLHATGGEVAYSTQEKTRYDVTLWQDRFNALYSTDKSKAAIYRELREKYNDEDVPGDTWLKEHIAVAPSNKTNETNKGGENEL